jgi:hypothetical protein
MAGGQSANPKRRPGRPRKGTAMQVITEPEQNLLPEQIKKQILAGEGANDVQALRFQAETVARFSDESLLRHEINIYQLAGLLEILSERFRESGLEEFDQWLAEHHPITARKLGKPTKRHELMHLAKANAQQMIEEIGVGKAQVLNRLLKQGIVNNLEEARQLVEDHLGIPVLDARINEDLKGAVQTIVAEFKRSRAVSTADQAALLEAENPEILAAGGQRVGTPRTSTSVPAPRRKPPWGVKERIVTELYEESFFVFQKISLYGGNGQLSLPFESLGLSAEVIEVLKGNRASKPLIRIFEEHSRIVIRLRSKIARLQSKFMYRLEPYWAVPEKSLEALLAGFNEIDEQIESEKKLLIADYEKHYTQFLETIAGIAHAQSGDMDQALNVLRIYAERFPEPAEIQSNFRLAILGPTRLPSMQEQAQRDAAVMSALAETKRAQAEYDAAQSLERMQERTAQEMQRLMQQLCLNVQEELYGAMAEVLGQLETLTKGRGKANLSISKQNAIEEVLESLAKLGELGANPLNGIASQMESLYQQQVAKMGRDASKGMKSQAQQELKTRIQTIRQELEAQLPEDSSSAGNRKLWEWLRA